MKRGEPLKRSTPLRRTQLVRGKPKGTTEVVRVTVDRTPRPPADPHELDGPLKPSAWRRRVWELDGGVCVACGGPVEFSAGPWTLHVHHPVMKQLLEPTRRYDERNGIALHRRCHERHTSRTQVITAGQLPERCMAFAIELGPWAVDRLGREHPSSAAFRRAGRAAPGSTEGTDA